PIPSLEPSNIHDSFLTPRIDALSNSIPVLNVHHLLNDDINHAYTLTQSNDENLTSNYLHGVAQMQRRLLEFKGIIYNHIRTGMQSLHPVLDKVHQNTCQAKQFAVKQH
ncbi:uncharacterized protein BT62DRAFT_892011, partial [Guyanagaster necrorhizus]